MQQSKTQAALRRIAKNAPKIAAALEVLEVDAGLARKELYPDSMERDAFGREGFFIRFFETLDSVEKLIKWAGQNADRALKETNAVDPA